jgi:hypothetical protein
MKAEELFNTLFPPMNKEEQAQVLKELAEQANDEAMVDALKDPIQNFK